MRARQVMTLLAAFEGLTGSVRLGSDGDRLARFTLVNLYVCTTKDDSRCGRRRLASPGSTLSLEQTRAAFVTVGEYDSITQDLTVRPACHAMFHQPAADTECPLAGVQGKRRFLAGHKGAATHNLLQRKCANKLGVLHARARRLQRANRPELGWFRSSDAMRGTGRGWK